MAALEIDCAVLSLPLEMGRTSNRAGDESQNDTLVLSLDEKRKRNIMIMPEKNFTAGSISMFPDKSLGRWIPMKSTLGRGPMNDQLIQLLTDQ